MGGSHGEQEACTPRSAIFFTAGVVMGTVNTLAMKIMYGMQSVGTDGKLAYFEKPIFLTLVMFLAMTLSLPIYYIYQNYIVAKNEREPPVPIRVLILLIVPSIFDLLGTVVSQIGLLYVTPSLFMLIRCSVIIVTAMLKVFVLKDRIATHMWIGVAINFLAMCIVSAPSFMGHNADATGAASGRDPRIGIMFILLSCLVQGSQYVFEEKVMSVDNAHPLIVVGMEGFWGSVLSIGVAWPLAYLLPGTDKGCMENMYDAFVMVGNSSSIFQLCAIFFVSVALYNVFAVFITHFLSSIWHAILDNFRPIAVWAVDLVLFYLVTKGAFGESWSGWGSWLQLFGMFILLFGTAVYNGSIPFIYFPEAERNGIISDAIHSSPALIGHSPLLTRRTPQRSLLHHDHSHSRTSYNTLDL